MCFSIDISAKMKGRTVTLDMPFVPTKNGISNNVGKALSLSEKKTLMASFLKLQ